MRITLDADGTEYEFYVEYDCYGDLESIKLAGSEKCLIAFLYPEQIRAIEDAYEAAAKADAADAAIDDYEWRQRAELVTP